MFVLTQRAQSSHRELLFNTESTESTEIYYFPLIMFFSPADNVFFVPQKWRKWQKFLMRHIHHIVYIIQGLAYSTILDFCYFCYLTIVFLLLDFAKLKQTWFCSRCSVGSAGPKNIVSGGSTPNHKSLTTR